MQHSTRATETIIRMVFLLRLPESEACLPGVDIGVDLGGGGVVCGGGGGDAARVEQLIAALKREFPAKFGDL